MTLDLLGSHDKVPVIWTEARCILDTKDKTMLGICGYSKRVFAIAPSLLHLILIQDIYVEPQCEERAGCLDFDCPKNKTTWMSYCLRRGIKTKKKVSGFGKRINFNCDPDGKLHDFGEFFEKYPEGGIMRCGKRT